jgi:hypothetical protein
LIKQIIPDEPDPTIRTMDIITAIITSIMKIHIHHLYLMQLLTWIDPCGITIIGDCCMTGEICETPRGVNVTSSFLVEYVTGIS